MDHGQIVVASVNVENDQVLNAQINQMLRIKKAHEKIEIIFCAKEKKTKQFSV